MAGGVAAIVGSAVAEIPTAGVSTVGIAAGVAMILNGFDNAHAGLQSTVAGAPVATELHKAMEPLVGPEAATGIEMVVNAASAWKAEQALSRLSGPCPPTAAEIEAARRAADAERAAAMQAQLLQELQGGGSWLMTERQFNEFARGMPTIGRPDGQFMTSATRMNQLLHETGGNPALLGERLGVSGWGPNTPLIRMDVTDPLLFNPRTPTSSMSGANSLFRPGGFTSGGVPEIVTDQLPWYQVWSTPLR